MIRKRLSRVA